MHKLIKMPLKVFSGATLVTLPVIATTSFAAKTEDKSFIFDGRIFNNEKDALKYLVQYNKIQTEEKKVWGDLNKSFSNAEKGLLNKSLLPTYDKNSIKLAYFNAGRGITYDYNAAKNSYYNPGRVRTMYVDGFTNAHYLSELQAKAAMNAYKLDQGISYYNVNFLQNANNLGNKIAKETKINPFNQEDIEAYKDNISKNIKYIIKENLTIKKGENDKSKQHREYDVKVLSGNKSSNSPNSLTKTNLNLTTILKSYISKQGKDVQNLLSINESGHMINVKMSSTAETQLTSGWSRIGNWEWNDSTTQTFAIFNDYKLDFRAANYGDKWQWINKLFFYEEMNENQFTSFLKGELGDANNLIDYIDNTAKFDTNKFKIDTSNIIANLQREIDNNQYRDFIPSSDRLLDDDIKNILNEQIKEGVKDSLQSMKDDISTKWNDNSRYSINSYTQLQDLIVNGRDSGVLGINNDIQIKKKSYYFDYDAQASFNTNKEISTSTKNTELYNLLLNWKKDNSVKTVEISKNGHPLFNVDLKVNKGKLVVNKIVISPKNSVEVNTHTKISKIFKSQAPLVAPNTTPNKDLYAMLMSFRDKIITKKEDAQEIVEVFKKYLGDDGEYSKLNNPFYESPLVLGSTGDAISLEQENVLKMFWASLNETYLKFKTNKQLLAKVGESISKIRDILVLKDDIKNNNYKPYFSMYRMTAITDFNTKLSSGTYSGKTALAKNNNEFAIMKSAVDKTLPAQILIAYDNNGLMVNSGGYQFDNEILMEFNAKMTLQPDRDYDHIFVRDNTKGPLLQVTNQTNIIYELTLENQKLYFDKNSNLRNYLLQYIQDNLRYL